MKVQIFFALLLTVVRSVDVGDGDIDFRKHYGLSFTARCKDYKKTFTCMTECKSIGFQIFRLDFRCKCSCHEMRTTTLFPFFKWQTNGTTMTRPITQSPSLYHIVGTLSPTTRAAIETTTDISGDTEPTISKTPISNTTDSDTKDTNTTDSGGEDQNTTQTDGDTNTDGTTTDSGAEGSDAGNTNEPEAATEGEGETADPEAPAGESEGAAEEPTV